MRGDNDTEKPRSDCNQHHDRATRPELFERSYVNVKSPRDNKGEPVSRGMPTLLSRSSQAHDANNIREP